MALGYTLQLPERDRVLISKSELLNEIAILIGGRSAEEVFFDDITTGARNDIQRATQIARQVVCEYGMTSLGNRTYGKNDENAFLGRDLYDHSKDYSEETAKLIDDEILKILEQSHKQAKSIINKNKDAIEKICKILLEKEILEGKDFDKLIKKYSIE